MAVVDITGLRDRPNLDFYKPNIATETAFGLARGVQGLIGSVGDIASWAGEVYNDEGLADWGKRHSEYWQEQATTGIERPRDYINLKSHPFLRSAGLLGEALPSVALGYLGGTAAFGAAKSAGLTAKIATLTKVQQRLANMAIAFAGTQPLGAIAGAGMYREAREAGLDVASASTYGVLSWVGESLLEVAPLMEFLRPGTNVGRKMLRVGLTEGAEEFTQEIFSNALKIYGWKGTQNLYEDLLDGTLEAFIGGALAGGVMGGGEVLFRRNQHTLEEISSDLARKLRRDGVVDPKTGKPFTYEATETMVGDVANKVILDKMGDLLPNLEKVLKDAGYLDRKILSQENAAEPVVSHMSNPGVLFKHDPKPTSSYDQLFANEQAVVDKMLDEKMYASKLMMAKGRPLTLKDEQMPSQVKFELRELATEAYKNKKEIDPDAIDKVFQEKRIFVLEGVAEGDVASEKATVFYGPRMFEDISKEGDPTNAILKKSPVVPLRLLAERFALASKLGDSPAAVDLARIPIIGTRALSPVKVAQRLHEAIRQADSARLDDIDIMGEYFTQDAIADGIPLDTVTLLENIRTLINTGKGPKLLRSTKDLQIIVKKTAPSEGIMAEWTAARPEQLSLFADEIQTWFETEVKSNPEKYHLETLEQAFIHKIMHEQGHFLLRTDQQQILKNIATGNKIEIALAAEKIETARYHVIESAVSPELINSLLQWNTQESQPVTELMNWMEEITVEALAYQQLHDLDPDDLSVVDIGKNVAYYNINGRNFSLTDWMSRYNAENAKQLTAEDINAMLVAMYKNIIIKSQHRQAIAEKDEYIKTLQGLSSWTTGRWQRFNPGRTAKRNAGRNFRDSGVLFQDDISQKSEYHSDYPGLDSGQFLQRQREQLADLEKTLKETPDKSAAISLRKEIAVKKAVIKKLTENQSQRSQYKPNENKAEPFSLPEGYRKVAGDNTDKIKHARELADYLPTPESLGRYKIEAIEGLLTDPRTKQLKSLLKKALDGNRRAYELIYQNFTESEIRSYFFGLEKEVALLDQETPSDSMLAAEKIVPEVSPEKLKAEEKRQEQLRLEQERLEKIIKSETEKWNRKKLPIPPGFKIETQRDIYSQKDLISSVMAEYSSRIEAIKKAHKESAAIEGDMSDSQMDAALNYLLYDKTTDINTKEQLDSIGAEVSSILSKRGKTRSVEEAISRSIKQLQRWLTVQRDTVYQSLATEAVGDHLSQYSKELKMFAPKALVEKTIEETKKLDGFYYRIKNMLAAIHKAGAVYTNELWLKNSAKWLKQGVADGYEETIIKAYNDSGLSWKDFVLTKKFQDITSGARTPKVGQTKQDAPVEALPVFIKINFMLDQLETVRDWLSSKDNALNVNVQKNSMVIKETGMTLFDEKTNSEILIPPGDYSLKTFKSKDTIKVEISGNDLVLYDQGNLYGLESIVVDYSDLSSVPSGSFYNRNLSQSVQNSMWTGIRDSIADKLTARQKTHLEKSLNPDLYTQDQLEYSKTLKLWIAVNKKLNPLLTDKEIAEAFPFEGHIKLKTLATPKTVEEIVGSFLKERHFQSYASFAGDQINNIVTKVAWDYVDKNHTGTKDQKTYLVRAYLSLMQFANQEILTVDGSYDIRMSEVGAGGWAPGNIKHPKYRKSKINTAERDATIDIYQKIMKDLGIIVPQHELEALKKYRSPMLFWKHVPKQLQDVLILTKLHVENRVLDAMRESGILDRTDVEKNIKRGFTPVLWTYADKDTTQTRKSIEVSANVPRHKYRTATESVAATGLGELGTGLYTVSNYAAAMGHYVNESLRKVNQAGIIAKLKEVRAVDANGLPLIDPDGQPIPLGYIAYETDKAVLQNKRKLRPAQYLQRLGYKQMKDAPGLVDRRGGAVNHPWVHDNVASLLHQLYDQKAPPSKLMQSFLEINGFVKRQIMLSPYNFAVQIASSPWLWLDDNANMWNPLSFLSKKGYDLVIKPLFHKGGLAVQGAKTQHEKLKGFNDPYAHLKDSVYDQKMVSLFVKHGARSFNAQWAMETLFDTKKLNEHPQLRSEIDQTKELIFGKYGMDDFVFNHYVGRVMYAFMDSMTNRILKDKSFMPDSQPEARLEEASRLAVEFANTTSGMIDRNVYGAEGRFLQAVLFARDFTVSFIRQITAAAWPITKQFHQYYVGDLSAMNSILHGEKSKNEMQYMSKYYQAHLAKIIMSKMLIFGILQFGLSFFDDDDDDKKEGVFAKKRWFFMNEPGKFGMLRLPFKSEDKPVYADPLLWREASQFITLSPLGRGPEAFVKGKMSWGLKTIVDLISNRNFMEAPVTNATGDITMGEVFVDRALHVAKSTLPTFVRQRGGVPLFASIPAGAAGVQLSTGVNAKDPHELLKMRRAVRQEQYYDDKRRTKMYNASSAGLQKMLFNKEITRTQYNNEMRRRKDPQKYFEKRNKAKIKKYQKRTQ